MTNLPIDEDPWDSRPAAHAAQSHTPEIPKRLFDAEPSTIVRKRKRKRWSKRHRKGITIVVLVVVVVLAMVAGFAWSVAQGSSNLHAANQQVDVQTDDTAVTYDSGQTVSYNGHTYQYNTNMVSLLFIGFDQTSVAESGEAPGQADAVLVVAMDTSTGAVKIISIPRDSMVDVDVYDSLGTYVSTTSQQLCLAYSYGNGSDTSCQNVETSVSRVLYNIPMNYYYALDKSGIGPLANAVGGVTLSALDTIPGTTIVEGENQILTGNNAYKYVQYRDTTQLDSPLDRQERQIQFIKAFSSQVLSTAVGNIGMISNLYSTANAYSVTNISSTELTYMVTTMLQHGITSVDMTSLTGEMIQGSVYAEYHLDEDAVYQTVLDTYYTQIS
jgi:LCP family protein required for cell wall assembly